MKHLTIILNTPMLSYAIDTELNIEIDDDGIPTDKFWRSRLKDAEIDNCISVKKKTTKATESKK